MTGRRASQELDGSRAGGLHSRTIEVLDQRGIADRFLAEGNAIQVQGFAGIPLDMPITREREGLRPEATRAPRRADHLVRIACCGAAKRLAFRRGHCHDGGMPFPNLEGKHSGRPYVTARRLLEYHESRGSPLAEAPRAMVLTWQPRLEGRVRERRDHQAVPGPGVPSLLLRLAPGLGLARLPIGAPAAAIAVEELSARGTELFISVGTVGAIGGQLAAGDLVVCSAALRDEGTSHHYARPEPFAHPDPELTARLRAALPAAAFGPSWTTDAPYRETAEEIATYRAEAILTVEMEASCLFTVAKATGTAAAAAFVVSDVLHGEKWEPLFRSAGVLRGLWTLFEAAETCLRLAG